MKELTRKEVARLMKVTYLTVFRWDKMGCPRSNDSPPRYIYKDVREWRNKQPETRGRKKVEPNN